MWEAGPYCSGCRSVVPPWVMLLAVKRRGVAVVQDPEDALFARMPESALEHVDVDCCLPLAKITPLLARLSREEVTAEKEGAHRTVPEDMEFESKVAGLDHAGAVGSGCHIGGLSQFTCPNCTGPLFEIRDGRLLRYRCRVSHTYTAESVLEEKAEARESALYVALNTLEESVSMSRTLAVRASTTKTKRGRASRNGPGGPESRWISSARRGAMVRRLRPRASPKPHKTLEDSLRAATSFGALDPPREAGSAPGDGWEK